MHKRGLSTIIATLLIITLSLAAVTFGWVVIKKFMLKETSISEAKAQLFSERIRLKAVSFNEGNVSLVIQKLTGTLTIKKNESTYISPTGADIFSIVDLSGSMSVCSGASVTSSCCYNNLGGDIYSLHNCYGVDQDKGNNCATQCNGVWEDKITPTQNANKDLVNTLLDIISFKIGLVAYDSSVIDSASLDLTDNSVQLNTKIDSWNAATSTCICCGINEAIIRLNEQSLEENTKALIVMSDGQANYCCSGYNDVTGSSCSDYAAEQDAIDSACHANDTQENFMIYSVGVGNDVNEDTLTEIAKCGDGEYFPVANTSDLIDIYLTIAEKIEERHKSSHRFNYFIIIFYNATDSYQEIITDIPDILATKRYDIDLAGKLSGEIIKIEIYPGITIPGENIVGPLMDVWEKD